MTLRFNALLAIESLGFAPTPTAKYQSGARMVAARPAEKLPTLGA